jgi:hypothetical protein
MMKIGTVATAGIDLMKSIAGSTNLATPWLVPITTPPAMPINTPKKKPEKRFIRLGTTWIGTLSKTQR